MHRSAARRQPDRQGALRVSRPRGRSFVRHEYAAVYRWQRRYRRATSISDHSHPRSRWNHPSRNSRSAAPRCHSPHRYRQRLSGSGERRPLHNRRGGRSPPLRPRSRALSGRATNQTESDHQTGSTAVGPGCSWTHLDPPRCGTVERMHGTFERLRMFGRASPQPHGAL